MAITQAKQSVECEIVLAVSDEHPVHSFSQLLEMAVHSPVRSSGTLHDISWHNPDPERRLLITDYQAFRQVLGSSDWQQQLQHAKLLILECPEDKDKLQYLLYTGVSGILHADTPVEVLVKAIKAILAGELWFPRGLLSHYVTRQQKQHLEESDSSGDSSSDTSKQWLLNLSRREREVLFRLCTGASNEQIADTLYISIHTVKSHVRQILRKTNSRSRREVMRKILAEESDLKTLLLNSAA